VIINRHNYEEFFLLYVDMELDEVQRAEVEKFVQQNPDLGKELDMLKQSTLTNDEIRFEAKDILYKKEAGISLANYEEYFLLSADNQLSENEIAEVERFILKHPQLQDEFTLLQQTILPLETIKFGGKEILYHTANKKRSIPFTLIEISAAAAIIGLVATVWMFTQNNNVLINKQQVATNPQHVKTYSEPSNITQGSKAVTDQPVAFVNENRKNKIAEKLKRNTHFKRVIDNETLANTTTVFKQNTKKVSPANDLAVVQTPEPSKEKLPAIVSETKRNAGSNNASETVGEDAAKATFAVNQNANNEKPFAKETVYREMNNDDEERTLYIGATEINKNKLRGLLKRAANFFDKKGSKTETERTVQIASFEIKSK